MSKVEFVHERLHSHVGPDNGNVRQLPPNTEVMTTLEYDSATGQVVEHKIPLGRVFCYGDFCARYVDWRTMRYWSEMTSPAAIARAKEG